MKGVSQCQEVFTFPPKSDANLLSISKIRKIGTKKCAFSLICRKYMSVKELEHKNKGLSPRKMIEHGQQREKGIERLASAWCAFLAFLSQHFSQNKHSKVSWKHTHSEQKHKSISTVTSSHEGSGDEKHPVTQHPPADRRSERTLMNRTHVGPGAGWKPRFHLLTRATLLQHRFLNRKTSQFLPQKGCKQAKSLSNKSQPATAASALPGHTKQAG